MRRVTEGNRLGGVASWDGMHPYHHLYASQVSTVACPSCGGSAEVIDRFTLGTSDGPVLHLKVSCDRGHWYTLPADRVKADIAVPERAVAR